MGDASEPPGARDDDAFVGFFRQSAPYIRAHGGRTMVIVFGGEALLSQGFRELVHDVGLLHALGVRLVLVAGSRPQIDRRLQARDVETRIVEGIRVTDRRALEVAKEAAGANRVELERHLTTGLPGTPMAGARVRVAAGNFVTARPYGVVDGVDYGYTGRVRRIDAEAIEARLDAGQIVTLTPLGYSITGEAFNLSTPELAADTAIALGAEKLICLVEGKGVVDAKGRTPSELDIGGVEALLASKRRFAVDVRQHLAAALEAVRGGVPRAHLVRRKHPGALLRELYTRDGIGTMVVAERTEDVRPARPRDVPSLLQLLEPMAEQGLLVHRPRELLETDIDRFELSERDGLVVACAALYEYPDEAMGELACLAVHDAHRRSGRGEVMLAAIERRARSRGLRTLFVLTTQGTHWFMERGFVAGAPKDLPAGRGAYDRKRASKVLLKAL
ncbi:MAG: amino-acid N-acetyltransferase [Myxococcota bacterium]